MPLGWVALTGHAGLVDTRQARDLRPVVLAGTVAVSSLGLLLAAGTRGWLGPDIGRGAGFCEAARDGWVRQPANTWSNLGFVVAGLAIAWRAGMPTGRLWPHRRLASILAVVVVLLGPASMAMHATQSSLGGRLDLLSMYLIAGFAATYAWMRLLRRGLGFFVGSYLAVIVVCELVENGNWDVPIIGSGANAGFGAFILTTVVGEAALMRRSETRRDHGWGFAALGLLLVALAIWTTAKTGSPACHPQSLLQGHAAWHLLDAGAAWCLYRLYASEEPLAAAAPRTSVARSAGSHG